MVWQMILYNQIKDTFTQEELEIINLRNWKDSSVIKSNREDMKNFGKEDYFHFVTYL